MIEGKLANRSAGSYPDKDGKLSCEKCSRKFPAPKDKIIQGESKNFYCKSYVGTSFFIYETQGGGAVCYCSSQCLKKHNHRFRSK